MTEPTHKPFERRPSVFYSTLGPRWFGKLISLLQIPRVGVPDVRHEPLFLQEKRQPGELSPIRCPHAGAGVFFPRPYLCLSVHLDVVLLSFVVGSSSSSFQTVFRGKEGELRIFRHSHLETPLPKELNKMQVLIQ